MVYNRDISEETAIFVVSNNNGWWSRRAAISVSYARDQHNYAKYP